MWGYIVGYTIGNSVLQWPACGAIKRDSWWYIRRYTSPNENFEYFYPQSNALLQFFPQIEALQATLSRTSSNDMWRNKWCQTISAILCYPIRRCVTKPSASGLLACLSTTKVQTHYDASDETRARNIHDRPTNSPSAIRHSMAYRWWAVGGPLVCARWVEQVNFQIKSRA